MRNCMQFVTSAILLFFGLGDIAAQQLPPATGPVSPLRRGPEGQIEVMTPKPEPPVSVAPKAPTRRRETTIPSQPIPRAARTASTTIPNAAPAGPQQEISPSITGIRVSNNVFLPGSTNTVVGTVMVTMAPAAPPFAGSLALTGTNSGGFHLVGSGCATGGTCMLEAAPGGTPAGTYTDFHIVATQAEASGLRFTQPLSLTGSAEVLVTTATVQNTGRAGTNAYYQFAQGFRRGDVATSGQQFVLHAGKNCTGTTLATQVDEIASFHDSGWIQHAVFDTQIPSIAGSGGIQRIAICKQAGVYTPGTGLAPNAITRSPYHLTLKYQNVIRAADGSSMGNFTCDANPGLTGGAFAGNINNPGYIKTSDGALQTTYKVQMKAVHDDDGVKSEHLYCIFYIVAWQTAPGSGVLGNLQYDVLLTAPWLNVTSPTQPSAIYYGDLKLYQDGGTTPTVDWGANNPHPGGSVSFASSAITPGRSGYMGAGVKPGELAIAVPGQGMQSGEAYLYTGNAGGLTSGALYWVFMDVLNGSNIINLSLSPTNPSKTTPR